MERDPRDALRIPNEILALVQSDATNEIADLHPKRISHDPESSQSGTLRTRLDPVHVGTVQASFRGELVLSQALFSPELLNP